jgi:hypothetical protein
MDQSMLELVRSSQHISRCKYIDVNNHTVSKPRESAELAEYQH